MPSFAWFLLRRTVSLIAGVGCLVVRQLCHNMGLVCASSKGFATKEALAIGGPRWSYGGQMPWPSDLEPSKDGAAAVEHLAFSVRGMRGLLLPPGLFDSFEKVLSIALALGGVRCSRQVFGCSFAFRCGELHWTRETCHVQRGRWANFQHEPQTLSTCTNHLPLFVLLFLQGPSGPSVQNSFKPLAPWMKGIGKEWPGDQPW